MSRVVIAGAVVGLALGCGLGCSRKGSSTQPLLSQSFTDKQTSVSKGGRAAAAPLAGGPVADLVRLDTARPATRRADVIAPAPLATEPATTQSGLSLGTYMTIGTVVAEANGQPIYADKVLANVEPVLSAKARELDEATFKRFVTGLLREQIDLEIFEELEFAAADRAATEEERQQASGLTTQWRQREIIKAGGSEAVTRRKWLEGPEQVDFDEKVQERYRRVLVYIHYEKRIFPLVSLTAEDMRAYYDQNFERLFNSKATVKFRVIKVDVARRGGPVKAMELAQDLRERAARGDNFAEMAAQINDEPAWRRTGGYMFMQDVKKEDGSTVKEPAWIPRGALGKLEAVEKAVFELNPGGVTQVIDGGDALYIAKLEEKQGGTARAFDDPTVQAAIREVLEAEQRNKLRMKERMKLLQTAIHRKDERGLELAVDMAMQRYGVFLRGNANRGTP